MDEWVKKGAIIGCLLGLLSSYPLFTSNNGGLLGGILVYLNIMVVVPIQILINLFGFESSETILTLITSVLWSFHGAILGYLYGKKNDNLLHLYLAALIIVPLIVMAVALDGLAHT